MPEVEIKVKGYRCNNCGYIWQPRSSKEKPLICPKCKSARWDKEPKKLPKRKV
jgi:predicted Zn-ribbon and HTH transcriptional regulator